jgi:hypothetical protein
MIFSSSLKWFVYYCYQKTFIGKNGSPFVMIQYFCIVSLNTSLTIYKIRLFVLNTTFNNTWISVITNWSVFISREGLVVIIWLLDLQLPVQSYPVTTKVVSSNATHGDVLSKQHCVIKFVTEIHVLLKVVFNTNNLIL